MHLAWLIELHMGCIDPNAGSGGANAFGRGTTNFSMMHVVVTTCCRQSLMPVTVESLYNVCKDSK